jgi:hypothetical protein
MSASVWAGMNHATDSGVALLHSAVTLADITDGASNTYMVGEKCCDPDHYIDNGNGWDDQVWDCGVDYDTVRFTGINVPPTDPEFQSKNALYFPTPDTPGYVSGFQFGSAHPSGFSMAMCDGSVQFMNYTIDPATHWYLGNRQDGISIDPHKL